MKIREDDQIPLPFGERIKVRGKRKNQNTKYIVPAKNSEFTDTLRGIIFKFELQF
jgi:hypothetical protein